MVADRTGYAGTTSIKAETRLHSHAPPPLAYQRVKVVPPVPQLGILIVADRELTFPKPSSAEALVEVARGVQCEHADDRGSQPARNRYLGPPGDEAAADAMLLRLLSQVDRVKLCVEPRLRMSDWSA